MKQFLTDRSGKRLAVVLDMKSYEKMVEQIEDLEDILACDRAKSENEKAIPLEQARAEIERKLFRPKKRG